MQVSERADGSRVDYGYDDLYRLTGETRTGSNAYSISYTYDNVGNRLTKDHDGVMTSYVYNNRDQVTSETNNSEIITYTYDGSGRTGTKTDNSGFTTYGWGDNDRLLSVALPSGTVTYTYDAAGNKMSMNDGTATKNYLVDMLQPYAQVIAEHKGLGAPTAEYVYGLERISQNRAGAVSVFIADGQGSVRELTDGAGNVTDTYSYLAFGEELSRAGTTENNFKFVGEEIDPNSGFSYNRARWYNMSNGRFISVDPYKGNVILPQTLHRYTYAENVPTTHSDPTGKFTLMELMVTVSISNILATNVRPIKEMPKIKNIVVNMSTDYVHVYYRDGSERFYIAATGDPNYPGATRPARGHVVSTALGPVGTYYPKSWQDDEDSPYGAAMIVLSGTGGRHIHGTNGPIDGGTEYLTHPTEGRSFTHGCARLLNRHILKLRKEVQKDLRLGAFIKAEFK